jgi:hypothetical protein
MVREKLPLWPIRPIFTGRATMIVVSWMFLILLHLLSEPTSHRAELLLKGLLIFLVGYVFSRRKVMRDNARFRILNREIIECCNSRVQQHIFPAHVEVHEVYSNCWARIPLDEEKSSFSRIENAGFTSLPGSYGLRFTDAHYNQEGELSLGQQVEVHPNT